jgi:hypothetical protein
MKDHGKSGVPDETMGVQRQGTGAMVSGTISSQTGGEANGDRAATLTNIAKQGGRDSDGHRDDREVGKARYTAPDVH